jgi:hypothetical protein
MIVGVMGPLAVAAMACHPTLRTPPVAIKPDTVAGVVSITGTAFEQHIVLRSGQVVIPLSAAPSDSAALSRMGGVQVEVVGRWGPGLSFLVERFTAVDVAESPVVDGFVRKEGDRLVLETTHGRIPLGNPPTALRGMIGARVWIGGPLDKGPNTYGVIVPAQ